MFDGVKIRKFYKTNLGKYQFRSISQYLTDHLAKISCINTQIAREILMRNELKDMRAALEKTAQFVFRVKTLDLHQSFFESADHTCQTFGYKALRTMVPAPYHAELLMCGAQEMRWRQRLIMIT